MDLVEPPVSGSSLPAGTDTAARRGALAHRLFGTPKALAGWATAALVANCGIIVTGAVVRLTASGLGCPTWPRCDSTSFVPREALGYHGLIEFGNRLLTFVLIAIAVCLVLAAYRTLSPQKVKTLSWIALVGLPFQGVVGGLVTLSGLNPWVVALHLLLSIALIVLSVYLLQAVRMTERAPLPPRLRTLVQVLFGILMLAIWLGTVVTGAGPHAGDQGAHRNNLNIEVVAKIHAWTVWIAVALTAYLIWQVGKAGLDRARRLAVIVMGALLLQGMIGYAQYFLGLPVGLVICHMIGIGIVTTAISWFFFGTRRGAPA